MKKRKPVVYRCAICGEIAHYGFKVALREGKEGVWYCVECAAKSLILLKPEKKERA
jgi:DNA-directed RNA polymerase subunit RPC12/RpoP